MVKSGQRPVRPVDFDSRIGSGLPVEVLDRLELLDRTGASHFEPPQRPTFPQFMLVRSAGGAHVVDFESIPARPGRMIHTRPGQVQLWDPASRFEATLIVAAPAVASEAAWFPGHRPWVDLDDADVDLVGAIAAAIERLHRPYDGSATTRRLMRALFDALGAIFERVATTGGDSLLPPAYLAYRDAIEADLSHAVDVTEHARRLGYSPRTLSRACRTVTGQTAKAVLVDRIVLEAKRLLVHSDDTAAAIGDRLGFSEPTNFSKFFSRNTGTTPNAFRGSYGP